MKDIKISRGTGIISCTLTSRECYWNTRRLNRLLIKLLRDLKHMHSIKLFH